MSIPLERELSGIAKSLVGREVTVRLLRPGMGQFEGWVYRSLQDECIINIDPASLNLPDVFLRTCAHAKFDWDTTQASDAWKNDIPGMGAMTAAGLAAYLASASEVRAAAQAEEWIKTIPLPLTKGVPEK